MADSAVFSTLNSDTGGGFSRPWINYDAKIAAVSTEEVLVASK